MNKSKSYSKVNSSLIDLTSNNYKDIDFGKVPISVNNKRKTANSFYNVNRDLV